MIAGTANILMQPSYKGNYTLVEKPKILLVSGTQGGLEAHSAYWNYPKRQNPRQPNLVPDRLTTQCAGNTRFSPSLLIFNFKI